MSGHERTVMHRVLNIPELLDMVFSFLEPPSNAVNARVCRRWSEIALDALWKDVRDLELLFGLLAPLRISGGKDGYLEFERMPDSSDWKRFDRYTKRVRRVEYDALGCKIPLHKSVFDDVARTRTRLDILPNMHTLHWKASLELAVMFMHKAIKNFAVYLPELNEISPRPFFEDVSTRMPNLTSLDIRTNIPVQRIENEMVNLFQQLPKIQKVTFPRYYFTTRIAEVLSKLENLGVVEFQYLDYQGSGDVQDVIPFVPSFTEGAFPALWDHSMAVSFDDAARFLDIPFSPTNLTMLYLDSYMIESPFAIRKLLNVISENCQLLTFLALVSLRDAGSPSLPEPQSDTSHPDHAITVNTLKPLFKLPNLTSLELVHQFPLALNSEDIRLFAVSWPSIRSLMLNTEPAHLTKSNLTLHDLLPFAQHCTKLRHLGLFIDSRLPTSEQPSTPSSSSTSSAVPNSTPAVQFKSLERLSMGVSLIDDENAVTLFLSQILPLNCQIDSGITWDETLPVHPGISSVVQDRCMLWLKVSELLPVLTKLRAEERARTRAMEMELEDLRMRTKVLNDSASIGVRLDISSCVMI
ncbi:hypothetical protein JR316_0012086 [Psilocybe cubensis]|uniref:Uncharacterized protein n=2 Tax=Psilocybe cubensis TaxID=181762 RepID=A0ACB8GHV0_PSICU|nr:hypothetical protein JR316_0012086 [Psilocybe cubensis]KAH9474987.1 hypothetical protein JR316_0012086 [Psilocybe cubensis]